MTSYLVKIFGRRTKNPPYQSCIENVITQDLKLDKKKENQKQSFFTLKDHKENFLKNLQVHINKSC